MITEFPPSLQRVLKSRGFDANLDAFLNPTLEHLASPHQFGQMEAAVQRLLLAVRLEQPVAIYADRDVDGLTGLAILVRTLRSLGGQAVWGSPTKGRGVDRDVLEKLLGSGAKVIVLVDCGTGEFKEIEWLANQGVDVIVADHHRLFGEKPPAFAWIHPQTLEDQSGAMPAGCVMAFKLAQAIWLSFLGQNDPERMDYFLFSHLDLVCLGILADRVPLKGENRTLVWHGLRRLAYSRKLGIAALTRFFRLTPRSGPLTVREVSWQLIPILNAGGRLGRPDITAELLITEDADVARNCIDDLLALNTQRRAAQDKSLAAFEEAVLSQCTVDADPVLVAMAEGLEPAVTGLAAQALVRKYNRPVFLFVRQEEEAVGSGRGLPGCDLFAWVQQQEAYLVKFGGHQGAVGLTLRPNDLPMFRERLLVLAASGAALDSAVNLDSAHGEISAQIEAELLLEEMNELWWTTVQQMGPYGMGHPLPLFQINDVEVVPPVKKRRSKRPPKELILKSQTLEVMAEFETDQATPPPLDAGGLWTVVGYPVPVRKDDRKFIWKIRNLWRKTSHA